MGSVKKKVDKVMNKVADKLVPKELAPVLPFAAMMIPGLQGMAPLLRYGIPQALTALSSAKTTGKINPLAQAMTGLASYAAGPGGQAASGKQQAFFDQNVGQVDPALAEAAGGAQGMTGYELTEAGKGLNLANDPISFARANPDKFKAFTYEPSNMLEQAGNLFRPAVQKIGGAINNPFGSFGNFATAAGTVGAPVLLDQMTLAADKAEAEAAAAEAAQQQAMSDYFAGIQNLTGFYGQMGTDPVLQDVFGDYQFINKGGRVGAMSGLFTGDMVNEEYLPEMSLEEKALQELKDRYSGILGPLLKMYDERTNPEFVDPFGMNTGGRVGAALGAMGGSQMYPMNPAPGSVAPNMPQGVQVDGRNGTFIPMGAQEKKDDVPAMLAKNEFVMTSDAVKGMGNGDVNAGAQKMYDLMNQLEAKV
jgi:hypothetical protein